jgi:hypothetical protein
MLATDDGVECRPYRSRTCDTLIKSQVHKKLEDASLSISLLLKSALYYKRGVQEGRSPSSISLPLSFEGEGD